jgi:predicted outer membrane repeat protein
MLRHRIVASAAFALCLSPVAFAVRHVPSVADPTIQDGIDNAADHELVIVHPGVFSGPGNQNITYRGRPVHVRGMPGAIVDPGGAARAFIFDSGEGADSILEGIEIRNGFDAGAGGGIYIDQSSPTILDCTIESCSSGSGGGVYLVLSDATFEDCRFAENSATVKGGGVYDLSGDGTYLRCVFEANDADTGGGLHLLSNANPTLTECTFLANTATTSGGGLYVDNGSDPQFVDCTVEANVADHDGGGMFVDRSSAPALTATAFLRNEAGNDGGGLASFESAPTFEDVTFDSNQAARSGGGMLSHESSPTFAGGSFKDNVAAVNGGGLASASGSDVTLEGVDVESNQAGSRGGGLFTHSSAMDMTGGMLRVNQSVLAGGGAFQNQGEATFTDVLFEGNGAGDGGGGLFVRDADVLVAASRFRGNSTPMDGGGGMLALWSNVEITETEYALNTAPLGGGLRIAGSVASIRESLFSANATTGDGGAIHSAEAVGVPSDVTMLNVAFYGNSAVDCGGALDNNAGSLARLDNCLFSGNTSPFGNGGAICNRFSTGLLAVNNTFSRNSAANVGGGIFNDVAPADVVNGILWENADSGGIDESAQIHVASGAVALDYSILQGLTLFGGVGNLPDDPLFVDPAGADGVAGTPDDDLHVLSSSPAIGAGDNAPVIATTDLDGRARIIGTDVDMGVYETCAGDINGDGVVDTADLVLVLAAWGPCGGCAEDLDGSGTVDTADMIIVLAAWGPCP